MKIWHKALILAIVTEGVTITFFMVADGRSPSPNTLRNITLLLHIPAVILSFGMGVPILIAVLIEVALWMLLWFLLLRLFARPKDELTKLSLADHQEEWPEPHVKKIVSR